ncbi:MAG TPA: helix-hairpin-helix domain-containing protein [Candidatus Limnocylindria bacterium]
MPRWPFLLIPLLVVAGAFAALGARGHDDPPAVEAAPDPTPAPTPQVIVVDVVGAVAHPGVVRLPAGSRVLDALLAAGGMTGDADLVALNKAAPLRDGMRIYVPRPGEAVPAGGAGSAAETKVNLNTATASELDALPGVGPATAAAIVRARTAKAFSSVDELQTRGLLSPRVLVDLRDLVTVR